jgi:hypothetical protein
VCRPFLAGLSMLVWLCITLAENRVADGFAQSSRLFLFGGVRVHY